MYEDTPLIGAAPRRSRKPLLVVAGSVALVLATALLSHSSGVSEKEAVTAVSRYHEVPSIEKAQAFVDYCFKIFTDRNFEKVSAVLHDNIVFTSVLGGGRVYGSKSAVLPYMQTFPAGAKGTVTHVWRGLRGGEIWIAMDAAWLDPSLPPVHAVWKIDTWTGPHWKVLLCTRTDANQSVSRRVEAPVGMRDALNSLAAIWPVLCHAGRMNYYADVAWTPEFLLIWRPGPMPTPVTAVTSKSALASDLEAAAGQLGCQAEWFVSDYYQESDNVVHAVIGDAKSASLGVYYVRYVKSERTGIWQIEEEVVNV